MKEIKTTKSLCPECLKAIDATIYEDDGKVFIKKTCPEHGFYQELYWSDYNEYVRAEKFRYEGDGLENPRTEKNLGCPYDCGICPEHKSHTSLAIIDITNRCNLKCPVCFANASAAGYVYEPSAEEVTAMLENLHNNKPVPATALQFSGGEPTIRNELFDFIRKAKEVGFKHVEVNTNGVRIAQDLEYAKKLKEAGVSTIYLQFDGLTSDVYKFIRGLDLLEMKMKAIENLRQAGYTSIVLVVTLVKGVNDHQLGDIIKFAAKNFDVIRCVNVQPVSLCGRLPQQEREKMRITITDFMRLVEEQTSGEIKTSDFYPVPVVVPVSKAVGALKDKRYVEFTTHPHCGMATFVFIEKGKMVPITRYGNIEKFVESLRQVYTDATKGDKSKAKIRLAGAVRHIKFSFLRKYVFKVLSKGDYSSLGDFARSALMISSMHFMDPYNFDVERVQRCGIHYAIPDGRIIPFCAMNSIHRSKVEKELGVPIKEWKDKHKVEISQPI
ncbi:MAG: radical SAM protein [Candidatus Bathyarchaeota archaeon]|nr:radical SAM protein [Candidatus Bathyarchaeota archaeon]MDT8781851.1 radical SAM protein [Candidatus Bathyarchaeota archaeon]